MNIRDEINKDYDDNSWYNPAANQYGKLLWRGKTNRKKPIQYPESIYELDEVKVKRFVNESINKVLQHVFNNGHGGGNFRRLIIECMEYEDTDNDPRKQKNKG